MSVKRPLVFYDDVQSLEDLRLTDQLPATFSTILLQQTVPTVSPASGYVYVYVKADGLLYKMDANGSEQPITIDVVNDLNELKCVVQSLITELSSLGIPFCNEKIINFLNS